MSRKKWSIFLVFGIVSIVIFLTGCTKKREESLTLVSNAWIGYAPIFYADQKGYLKNLHIKVLPVVSLAEASETFLVGRANLVTTTQHEYYAIKEKIKDIKPVILLDRSNGGDMILSNRKIDELKKSDKIYAYLEVDSINYELLMSFLNDHNIKKDQVEFINEDQSSISALDYLNKPVLVVTYAPYDSSLKKKGYYEIASTKDINTLVVVDSICAREDTIDKNRGRLKRFKQIIDRSIKEIMLDKKGSYKLVAPYLDNISYKDYLNSFNYIIWTNNPSAKFLEMIGPLGYKEKDLVK